jgi:hypothetical protein
VITVGSAVLASRLVIGDLRPGVPELRPDSRYNKDALFFARKFAIGVDQLQIIATGAANACTDPAAMREVDTFTTAVARAPGVASAVALPQLMKQANVGWNEGNLRWHVLSRNSAVLAHSAVAVGSDRLMNTDCSALPLTFFLTDHRAATIDGVIAAVRAQLAAQRPTHMQFLLASGNIGVMAATNDGRGLRPDVHRLRYHLPLRRRHTVHHHSAGHRFAVRQRHHGRPGHWPENLHAAGRRPRCGHRRGLRHL